MSNPYPFSAVVACYGQQETRISRDNICANVVLQLHNDYESVDGTTEDTFLKELKSHFQNNSPV